MTDIAVNPNVGITANPEVPRYIAVEGPIGVGKTSLAKRLADSFNYEILLERSEDNPFLDRFYHNPKQLALATQLFFLFQRAQRCAHGHSRHTQPLGCGNLRYANTVRQFARRDHFAQGDDDTLARFHALFHVGFLKGATRPASLNRS